MQRLNNKLKDLLKETKAKYLLWVVFFVATYLIKRWTGFGGLMFIPGIVVAIYLPGLMVNQVFQINGGKQGPFLGYLLNIFSSVAIVNLAQYALKLKLLLIQEDQTLLLVLVNLAAWLFLAFMGKEREKPKSDWKMTRTDYLVLLTPLILFILTVLIDPYVENADNYLSRIKDSMTNGVNSVADSRFLFVPFVSMVSLATNISIVWIYKLLLSVFFYVGGGFFFVYCKNEIKDKWLSYLSYLMFAGASVIMVEANIVRPQIFAMAFAVPVLILSYWGLKQNDYLKGLVCLVYALVSAGFHELGVILILVALVANLIIYVRLILIDKVMGISVKGIVVALFILYPYTRIFSLKSVFVSSFKMVGFVINHMPAISWRWWFLDSYKTIDGYELGWKGLYAAAYYVYNGIGLFVLLLVLWWLAKKKRDWVNMLPVMLFSFIYLGFAEIMPRMGYFFLPNRAWPHLMIGLAIIIAWLASHYEPEDGKLAKKVVIISMVGLLISGVLITFYLTFNKIGTVYRGEMGAMEYVKKNIPDRSVILSSQNNDNLFNFYSNGHAMARIYWGEKGQPVNITKQILEDTVSNFSDPQYFEPAIIRVPDVTREVIEKRDNLEVARFTVLVSKGRTVSIPQRFAKDGPRYFFYSFLKNKGLAGQREYKQLYYNDTLNQEFFKNYSGSNVVYKDKNVIIIKI